MFLHYTAWNCDSVPLVPCLPFPPTGQPEGSPDHLPPARRLYRNPTVLRARRADISSPDSRSRLLEETASRVERLELESRWRGALIRGNYPAVGRGGRGRQGAGPRAWLRSCRRAAEERRTGQGRERRDTASRPTSLPGGSFAVLTCMPSWHLARADSVAHIKPVGICTSCSSSFSFRFAAE